MRNKVKKGVIREFCKKKGWKYQALATLLGVSPQTIKVWNTGLGRPNKWVARRLSEITGIPLSDLGYEGVEDGGQIQNNSD